MTLQVGGLVVQFLYGGYSKRQADVIPGIGIEEKGTTFSDMWALDLDTYAWEKVKKAGMPPGPRAGFTFAGAAQLG